MSSRWHRRSEKHRSAGRRAGVVTTIGAVLVLGAAPAPQAHADIDDLFAPIVDALSQTAGLVDPGLADAGLDVDSLAAPALAGIDPLASFDSLLSGWFQTLIYDPMQQLGQALDQLLAGSAASTDLSAWTWLFGDNANSLDGAAAPAAAAGDSANAAASTDVPETVAVPLRMQAVTEPVVDISVNGGPSSPVLVDTGSAGLVLPIWDMGLSQLSFPTGFGFGAYSGGLGYVYLSMPATVDFGNDVTTGTDVITDPTSVNAVIFAYPTSLQSLFTTGGTWSSFFAPAGVDGVLGIGPNAVGPSPDAIPTAALPGSWGDGVLIDQANGLLQFGPNPLGDGAVAVAGAPNAPLAVSINGGPLQYNVPTIIDSGGVYGTIPSSLLGSTGGTVPVGTEVSVYTNNGETLLYSYTVTPGAHPPTVISSGAMNTGNYPFAQQPVYIDNAGRGTTIFGGLPSDD